MHTESTFGTGGRITEGFRNFLARYFQEHSEKDASWAGNYGPDFGEDVEQVARNLPRYGYKGEVSQFDYPHKGYTLTVRPMVLVKREILVRITINVPRNDVRETDELV